MPKLNDILVKSQILNLLLELTLKKKKKDWTDNIKNT